MDDESTLDQSPYSLNYINFPLMMLLGNKIMMSKITKCKENTLTDNY